MEGREQLVPTAPKIPPNAPTEAQIPPTHTPGSEEANSGRHTTRRQLGPCGGLKGAAAFEAAQPPDSLREASSGGSGSISDGLGRARKCAHTHAHTLAPHAASLVRNI
ncbi:uncharacterized protein Tco025E_07998, partial [Trypanosoma conorhini]